jgi:threonine aldolase
MTVDLRSDTVTRPTAAMRAAMAEAVVGDDVYGEDPSARALEGKTAALLGKEAALFVPSGTMANQIALQAHCRPGEEVVIGEKAHVFHYECGAGGAFAGVQFLPVGEGGLFTADDVASAIKPDQYHLAPTRLVAVENTHNVSGGRIFPQDEIDRIAALARDRGLGLHLDGARLWNAAVATGKTPAELAAPFDTISVCFSKGLGAPVGSALVGPAELIDVRARRLRRMMGGAMRQVGVLCAAADHALEHHRERLAEDHENAAHLAAGLSAVDGIRCDSAAVETNIVSFELDAGDAEGFVERATDAGVLVGALDERRVRAVTHLDVSRADVERAVEGLAKAVG